MNNVRCLSGFTEAADSGLLEELLFDFLGREVLGGRSLFSHDQSASRHDRLVKSC